MNKGYLKGELCNRDGCTGVIIHEVEGSCSCHINPPCSYCTDDSMYCDTCGWEHAENTKFIKKIECIDVITPCANSKEDDGLLYDVIRYFDTYPEKTIHYSLTKSDAYKKASLLENRYLVTHEVRLSKAK
jgi:hypothetical protein